MKLKLKAQLDNFQTADGFDQASNETGLKCDDKSLTKQSFAEEADINNIVKRFNLTGQLPTDVRMPQYGDFTSVYDYHSAMNAVALANEAFDQLPAHIRLRFHNDPGEFVDFCSNDENREEAAKLGLVPPQVKEPPTPPSGERGDETEGEVPPPSPKSPKSRQKGLPDPSGDKD